MIQNREVNVRTIRLFITVCILFLSVRIPAVAWQDADPGALRKYPDTAQWLKRNNLYIAQEPADALKYGYILAFGEGLPSAAASTPAEKRLTAESAANVIASRNLVEQLSGFTITGERIVRDKRELHDIVRKTSSGFVKGAEEIHREYNGQDETALVIIKVGMGGPNGYATRIYERILADPRLKADLMGHAKDYRPKIVPADGAYDSLIVDATGQPFKPALINRVLNTKGEVLYDPSKIKKEVITKTGCGEYTNTVEKAREALALRGAKNPLVVKAAATVNRTDIAVSPEDALRIFSTNQKAGFFAEAMVAFVLR